MIVCLFFFHRFSIANLLITQGNLFIYLHLLRLFVDIYLSLPMCLFAVDGFAAMLVKHGSFYYPKLRFCGVDVAWQDSS